MICCCCRYIKGAPKSSNQDTEGTTLDCAPLHAFQPVKEVAARDAMPFICAGRRELIAYTAWYQADHSACNAQYFV